MAYDNGWGVEKDFPKAMELFKQSADAGYYRAQYNMAASYQSGDGVEFDPAKAMDLFQKSAAQGYYAAQLALGDTYVLSEGKFAIELIYRFPQVSDKR